MLVLFLAAGQRLLVARLGVLVALVHDHLFLGPILLAALQRGHAQLQAVDDAIFALLAGQLAALGLIALLAVLVRAFAFLLAADQHLLIALAAVLVVLGASQLLLIAFLGVLVTVGLLFAAGQHLDLLVALVRVLVVIALLLQAAHQIAVVIVAILVVLVEIRLLHGAAGQLPAAVARLCMPVGLQIAHVHPAGLRYRIPLCFAAGKLFLIAGLGVGMRLQAAHRRLPAGLRPFRKHAHDVCRRQHEQRQHQCHDPPEREPWQAVIMPVPVPVLHARFLPLS